MMFPTPDTLDHTRHSASAQIEYYYQQIAASLDETDEPKV
jgi:hypothetical protein